MAERQLILISPAGDKLPPASPFHNEGKTVAGWLVCWGLIIGSTILGVGMIAAIMPLVIAGSIVCAATLVAGGAFRAAGHGQPQPVLVAHGDAKGEKKADA
ncbi:hypothetical protein C8046_01615 [Serinibacter arcticus]|uniref:Uncharacterized protein n=1 Tax=Serinibacter arcticus TaxID=1655435 RepID=A0A2U1ZRI1_9MICO|nr:HGxxPAAW family protein [Serinibacter arcticus]PWD49599.1 hypothetical protein C8046_01615 [Serinibacter arcticus]